MTKQEELEYLNWYLNINKKKNKDTNKDNKDNNSNDKNNAIIENN